MISHMTWQLDHMISHLPSEVCPRSLHEMLVQSVTFELLGLAPPPSSVRV